MPGSTKLGGVVSAGKVGLSLTGTVALEASVAWDPAGAETMLQEMPVMSVLKPAQAAVSLSPSVTVALIASAVLPFGVAVAADSTVKTGARAPQVELVTGRNAGSETLPSAAVTVRVAEWCFR